MTHELVPRGEPTRHPGCRHVTRQRLRHCAVRQATCRSRRVYCLNSALGCACETGGAPRARSRATFAPARGTAPDSCVQAFGEGVVVAELQARVRGLYSPATRFLVQRPGTLRPRKSRPVAGRQGGFHVLKRVARRPGTCGWWSRATGVKSCLLPLRRHDDCSRVKGIPGEQKARSDPGFCDPGFWGAKGKI